MQFKTELVLLLLSMVLFAISAFFFTYQDTAKLALALVSYPYQGFALVLVGTGALFMVTAGVSYSRKSKLLIQVDSIEIERLAKN